MNSKFIMVSSALFLGMLGILLTFLSEEISEYFNFSEKPILLQLLGASFFAFAMINWTAKSNLIGGIYGRPISIGNFTHFFIGAMALIRYYIELQQGILFLVMLIYCFFAVTFGYIFFTHPQLNTAKHG